MMKKVGFKKYTIFLLVCFFALVTSLIVNAASTAVDLQIPYGITQTVGAGYKNFTCQLKDDGNGIMFDVKTNPDGTVSVSQNIMSQSGGSNELVCTHQGKTDGSEGPGTIVYGLTYLAGTQTDNIEIYLSVRNPSHDIMKELNAQSINSFTVQEDGREYIDLICNTTSCTAKMSDAALEQADSGQNLLSIVEISYIPIGSAVSKGAIIKYNMNAFQGAWAWVNHKDPNPLGTCSFSSAWEKKSSSTSNGQTANYYRTDDLSAKLPDCTPNPNGNTSIPVEFKGWLSGVSDYAYAITGTCGDAVPGSSITLAANGSYAPCYSIAAHVRLASNGGVVTAGGWTSIDNGYGYIATGVASIQLPNLTFSGFNAGETLDYWLDQNGDRYNVGDTVPLNNMTYRAVTNVTITHGGSEYKSVEKDKTFFLATQGMKTCSVDGSGSTYVTATMQNGDCVVAGKVITPSNTYADVIVTLENGGVKTYKFSVVQNTTSDSAADGGFVIDLTPPEVDDTVAGAGEADASGEAFDSVTNTCNEYYVGGLESPGAYAADSVVYGGAVKSFIYTVTTGCPTTDHNEYVAFCLDPGRVGPENSAFSYEKTQTLDSSTDLGKLANYLVNNYEMSTFSEHLNPDRVAAHFVARIVAIANGMGSVNEDGEHYAAKYKTYARVAEFYAANKDASQEEFLAAINAQFAFTADYSGVGAEMAKILAEFNDVAPEDEENVTVETTTTNATDYGANGYRIEYSGTIEIPDRMTATALYAPGSESSTSCNSDFGVCFEVISFNECTGSCPFTVAITAADASQVKIPTEDDYPVLSFGLEVEGGNFADSVFIVSPKDTSAKLQRMLIFNLGTPKLLIYWSIIPKECSLNVLDYAAHCNETGCNTPPFNEDLFLESGCCASVGDEVGQAYVANQICNGDCITSTLPQICSYDPSNAGQTDLYEINEGSRDGNLQIGDCVVNTELRYKDTLRPQFQRYDSAGNRLNIGDYTDNQYCEVTCKEDWQITMDSFGNYAGENAVAAGHYFQIVNNDIFIGGKRTCYTSYVDYNKYGNELVQDGKTMISLYNQLSDYAHQYGDIEEQTQDDITESNAGTRQSVSWTCRAVPVYEDGDPDPDVYSPVFVGYDYVVDSVTRTDLETYWNYSLNTNGEFTGEAGQGKYTRYSPVETSEVMSAAGATSTTEDPTELEFTQANVNYSPNGIDSTCYVSNPTPSCSSTAGHTEEGTASGSGYNGCNYTGDTPPTASAFSDLQTELLRRISDQMDTLNVQMTGIQDRMNERIEHMFQCQHFELHNGSDGTVYTDHANNTPNDDNVFWTGNGDKDGTFVQIETLYQPYVEYSYAEDAYMSILIRNGNENILEQFEEKNDKEMSGFKSNTNQKEEITININGGTEEVNLARNYLEFSYYIEDYENMWSEDTNTTAWNEYKGSNGQGELNDPVTGTGSRNETSPAKRTYKSITVCAVNGQEKSTNDSSSESEGVLDPFDGNYKWNGGSCYELKAPFITANYISSSIENSSFYKNKGTWYGSSEDLKEHGDTLDQALQSAIEKRSNMYKYNKVSELASGKWSPIGLFNVFPISLTTPRNLYNYTYTFYDIGSHYNQKIGRILGGTDRKNEDAIIEENDRTCFYEVYEELCLCCGDKINTYIYDDSMTQSMLQQFLSSSGYGYQPSDVGVMETNSGGTLSFATSSVNLSDMTSTNRDIADNWSDSSAFTYGGETNLTTGKGAELMTYIESQGENIYYSASDSDLHEPEYAYYLTPTTLSSIRSYNENHGYGVNYSELVGYGRFRIASDNGSWTASDDEFNNTVINFQHYGSKFLENLNSNPGVVIGDTLAKPGYSHNGDLCVVNEGSVNQVRDLVVNKGCRWVDYIENISDNSEGLTSYTYPVTMPSDSGYNSTAPVTEFRLAFK